MRTPGVIETADRWVKSYHISATGGEIPAGIQDAAYGFLPQLLPEPDDENPENLTILGRPWMGCVWEPTPLSHERSAWVRHVLQPDTPDLDGYLADALPEGSTGGRP